MTSIHLFGVILACILVLAHTLDIPRGTLQSYDRGDYIKMSQMLREYITPEMEYLSPDELHELAITHAQAGRIGDSLPYFKAVIDKQPYNPSFVNNLGVSLMRHSHYSPALACFLTAAYMTPSHADASKNVKVLHGLWADMPVDRVVMAMMDQYPQDPNGAALRVVDAIIYDGVPGGFSVDQNRHFLDIYELEQERIRNGQRQVNTSITAVHTPTSASAAPAASPADPLPTSVSAATSVTGPESYPTVDAHGHITTSKTPRARLPRVHWADLNKPENKVFRDLRLPFVLTGLFDLSDDPVAPAASVTARSPAARSAPCAGDAAEMRDGFIAQPASPLCGPDRPFTLDAAHMSQLLARETADFYPQNMGMMANKPYLVNTATALAELLNKDGTFTSTAAVRATAAEMRARTKAHLTAFAASQGEAWRGDEHFGKGSFSGYADGAYIQVNLKDRAWRRLQGAVTHTLASLTADDAADQHRELPSLAVDDERWMHQCLGSAALVEEFTSKLHWRMLVVGRKGSGMFNHMDVLRTGSYQIQLHGAKKWALCEPHQRAFLYGVDKVDMFAPNYTQYPLAEHARCWEDTVLPGQLVAYPRDYWHQTINLSDLTASLSSSVLNQHSHKEVAAELMAACDQGKYGWNFSASLCARLRDVCVPQWQRDFAV